jgi:hypothetical protein
MDWVLAYDLLHIIHNLTWLEVRDDPDEGYKDFGPTKISANRKRGDPPLFSKTQRTNVLCFCHKMHTNRKTWAWCWLAQEKHKRQGDEEIEKKRERQKEEPEKKRRKTRQKQHRKVLWGHDVLTRKWVSKSSPARKKPWKKAFWIFLRQKTPNKNHSLLSKPSGWILLGTFKI